ncbi:C40 family peptidase [Isoptericola sp. NPDC057391]|uniref:C40 family peptidase n=1 Tax=Isoptericola sp. NPDC057391 TaxID=3346117 RepID=UPI0036294FEE
MSTSLDAARPGTAAAAARRPRRAIIALAVAGALTGGGLIAAAPHASAAPATAVKTASAPAPRATLSVSKHSITAGQGTRPVYKVKVSHQGKAVSGKVRLRISGKSVQVKTLRHGKATFSPSSAHYRNGKNAARVVVNPSGSALRTTSTRTVGVKAVKLTRGQKIVRVAQAQVGDRYVYGANGPNAFDCSGLTKYVYKKATGKTLPRSSSAQKNHGKAVSRKNARPGDLIWTPGHVAVYVGNGKQVEAARPGVGVVKRHIWQDNPRFIRM